MADTGKEGSRVLEVLRVALLPIAIALVGGAFSWFQHQSEIEKQYLDRVASLLDHLASDDSGRKALAIHYMHALAKENKITQELADTLASAAFQEALGAEDKAEVQDATVVRAVRQNFGEVSRTVEKELPARVFLHIRDESARDEADRLQVLLEAEGYRVPDIRQVSAERFPSTNQLRFLKSADADLAAELRQLLARNHYDFQLRDLSRAYENAPDVKPKTFELWLATAGT